MNFEIKTDKPAVEIVQTAEKHEWLVVFFPGFNDRAEIFANKFKRFLLEWQLPVKVVIPYLNEIIQEGDLYRTWYGRNEGNDGLLYFNDHDRKVKALVEQEISQLKDPTKFILTGFSQGGRYLLHFLEITGLVPRANIIHKSVLVFIEEYSAEASFIKRNRFIYSVAKADPIVRLDQTSKSIGKLYKLKMSDRFKFFISDETNHKIDKCFFLTLKQCLRVKPKF